MEEERRMIERRESKVKKRKMGTRQKEKGEKYEIEMCSKKYKKDNEKEMKRTGIWGSTRVVVVGRKTD